ncbi:hypothetical protein FHT05_003804 [Xanthomonas arboricola]|uniref:hypothetical protein n=1 Tax=Xanthomonas arboricola TaxID=56448 RepID=UPI0016073A02|nr:hypothetical protein [Xanthomonas arboricola]MBB6259171.1 hypothetical protein [Xanthomonas arboricola]
MNSVLRHALVRATAIQINRPALSLMHRDTGKRMTRPARRVVATAEPMASHQDRGRQQPARALREAARIRKGELWSAMPSDKIKWCAGTGVLLATLSAPQAASQMTLQVERDAGLPSLG